MTPVHELLSTLAKLNVKLWVEEDRLKLSAPNGVLNSDLQAQLRQQKEEILTLFASQNASQNGSSNGKHNGRQRAIQPAQRTEPIPLSFAQQRLWFLAELEGPNATYNLPSAFRLRGRLQLPALQQALDTVIARHEILRTRFAVEETIPFQQIAAEQQVTIEHNNLSQLSSLEQAAAVQRWIDSDAQQHFNLAQGPLLHVRLLELSDDEHVLSLTLHHIISDGWSAGILMQELCTVYINNVLSKPTRLPPLTLQYADYAIWQSQQQATLARQLDYWCNHLRGAPPLLALPTDHARPSQQHFVGEQLEIQLDATLSQQVEQLARQHNATPHMTLLAAFALLLSRYCGTQEMVIGTPVANRNHPEIEPLIGFFVNTLALRFDLRGNPTFGELLQRVRKVTLDGYANQDAPFEQVVERLQPQRQLSHSPIFQVVFNLMILPALNFKLPGLEISSLESDTKAAKFDLALTIGQDASGMRGSWEFNSELFERATLARMANHWQQLLRAAIANPNTPIDTLSIFSQEELAQLHRSSFGQTRALPEDATLHALFEAQAIKTPKATAVLFAAESLSYEQLNQRANQLAHCLQSMGVQPGDFVGLCMRRRPEMIVGMLAILKTGAAYVPLDPELPEDRLRFLVRDASLTLVLTEQKLAASMDVLHLSMIQLDSEWQQIARWPTRNLSVRHCDPDPVYLIYTSGSTGMPKGVVVPHRGVANTILAMLEKTGLGVGDRFLQFVPFSFDASALEVFSTLCSGATLVLHPNPVQLSSLELLRLCVDWQISVVNFTVALWHQWVDDLNQQNLRFPKALRLFLTGGEKPSPERLKRWATLGPSLDKSLEVSLDNSPMTYVCSYGPTEASITSTVFAIDSRTVLQSPPDSLSLGEPLSNTSILLLDENQQLVPVGVTGEIYLGGAGVAKGYLNQETLTEEKFVHLKTLNALAWGQDAERLDGISTLGHGNEQSWGRWYRTGDLARRNADGSLEFMGRSDSQVKVRGFRVELGEIEAQIKLHPQVEEALVLAHQFGVNDKRLVAYVQTNAAQMADLKSFLKNRLPLHMQPSAIVKIDHWTLTHNGKIDRKALPPPDFTEIATDYVAPQGELEIALATIWQSVLGVEKVGAESNFFELGGHSLLATQVVSRIRQQLAIEVPLRALFEQPTLHTLAEQISGYRAVINRPPILAAARMAALPLSFAQQRLWLLQQLNPESGFFNMPLALRLDGQLKITALRASFEEIIRRHEVLRTTFPLLDGRPVQQIDRAVALSIVQLNLQSIDALHHESVIGMLAADEAAMPFDLATGPLLRLKLVRLTAERHVLLLTMHHIVGDDWSNVLLMQEFSALYRAFANGKASPLPPLDVQYADFALWQRQWLQDEALQSQLDYWRIHLADAPPLLQLPLDRPRPAQMRFVGNSISHRLAPALAQKVHKLCRQQQVTPHMMLFAAFAVLLSRYSGMDDIVIGIPVANRSHAQVEPLVGFFLNTLALRIKLQNQPSFLELLHQVKEVTTTGYDHQDVPFEQVLEALQRSTGNVQLSHTPIFQVMFNYLQDHGTALQLPGLQVTPLPVDNHTAKFDLTLTVTDSENHSLHEEMDDETEEVVLNWEYNSDIFDPATVEQMARHYDHLLQAALADLSVPVERLPMLDAQELQQLLSDWNQPQTQKSDEVFDSFVMHQLFEQQVERSPDAVAASCNGEVVSYRRLHERTNRWANSLVAQNVQADSVVAVLCPRNLDFLSAIVAIFKAGGAYLPIDPKTPTARIQSILQQSGATLLLTNQSLLPVGEASLNLLPNGLRPNLLLIEDLQRAHSSSAPLPVRSRPDSLAYVIFTSGSTGTPKGAMVEQRGLVNHLLAMKENLQLSEQDVIAQTATQSYVISVWQFLAALIVGCRVEIIPEEVAMEPESLLRALSGRAVTVLQIVPSLLRAMMTEIHHAPHLLSSLRWLIPTGEALPPALVRDWFAICPNIPLLNAYGSSECSDDVAHDRINEPPPDEVVNMPAGQPIRNVRMYVLDAQMQPVPIGVEGDLYVGGACVGRGYLNDPERTAAVFLRDPFDDDAQARLYKSGDKVRWLANGKVEYLGRRDFQVKIRGFRIELGEIEATLGKHSMVEQAAVVTREDGKGNKQIVAYVVLRTDARVTSSELRSFVGLHLPDYMLPSAIFLLEAMPLNANGKLNRLALPAVEQFITGGEQRYTPARNRIEAQIITILADVLSVDESKLGVHHNFFELGGQSLLSVQLLAQLRKTFGVELPLRSIFEHTTVEALADLVIEAQLATVDESLLVQLLDELALEIDSIAS